MSPIVTLILTRILDYLVENPDKITGAIKDRFACIKECPNISNSLQEFAYEPTEERLNKLHDLLKSKQEDVNELVKILINEVEIK